MKAFLFCFVLLFISCQKKTSGPKKDEGESSYSSRVDKNYRHFGDYKIEENKDISFMASSGFSTYNSVPWSNGIVPVSFKSSIPVNRQAIFFAACQRWGAVANIQCRFKKPGDKNFVFVTDQKKGECWTEVGQGSGGGQRTFNYGVDWCWDDVAILHELGHVLGLMHEHQRPDRDNYLEVHLENAGPHAFAYEILSIGSLDNTGPYDFLSIMHYWNGAYSINGQPILVPKKGYEKYATPMGRSKDLTDGDKRLIQQIYGAK